MKSRLAKTSGAGVARIDRLAADIERAGEALRSCTSFTQARAIGAAMETAEAGLRALGATLELQTAAAAKRLEAERWMGAFLADTLKRGNPKLRKGSDSAHLDLAKLGITRKQSSRWQQLAEIPATTFAEHVLEVQQRGEKLTTGGAIAAASRAAGYDGDESYTPDDVLEDVRYVMGGIDLDPFSNAIAQRTVKAKRFYTKEQNGLLRPWTGRVWFQPPYSVDLIGPCVDKLLAALAGGDPAHDIDDCVGLTNQSEAAWWHRLARRATAVCLTEGRLNFEQPDGKGGVRKTTNNRYAQSFFYFGSRLARFEERFEKRGTIFTPRARRIVEAA